MPPDSPPPHYRRWAALATILGGALWIFFSVIPIPLTTFIGVPFGIYAILGGWLIRQHSRAQQDHASARHATWGLGLGCAGIMWHVCFWGVIAGLVILSFFGVAALPFAVPWQTWPTPTLTP